MSQIKRFLREITKEKRFRRPNDKGIDWADTSDTEDDLEDRNEKGNGTVDRKERLSEYKKITTETVYIT